MAPAPASATTPAKATRLKKRRVCLDCFMVFTSVDVLTPTPRDRCMTPTVFLKASSVPKIWNDGVRSQRRRLADLFGSAAEQELVAAYCLCVEQQRPSRPHCDITV